MQRGLLVGVLASLGFGTLAAVGQEGRYYWWVHPPVDGNWSSLSSWNWTDRLPGSLDIANIVSETSPRIRVSIASGDYSVRSLFNNHELAITGGALTVLDQVEFGPDAVLSVRGDGRFLASGSADLGSARVLALEGGAISVVGGLTPISNRLAASGVGSRIDLPGAVSLLGRDNDYWDGEWPSAIAEDGATIDARRVRTIGGGLELRAIGPGSSIDLSRLERLGEAEPLTFARLWASDGGAIKTPNLVHVSRAEIICEGSTSTIDLGSVKSLDAFKLAARAGAKISLPQITSYRAGDLHAGLESRGEGSLIELSGLVEMGVYSHPSPIQAVDGGHVRIANLSSIEGAAYFSASGQGSVIDLSALESFKTAGLFLPGGELNASGGGLIQAGQVQHLENTWLLVDGPTSSLELDHVTKLTGSLTARQGGELRLPLPMTFQGTVSAEGAGSVVTLPNVRTAGGVDQYAMTVRAVQGGQVDMSRVDAFTTRVAVAAEGENSIVDLSHLAAGGQLELTLRGGGRILLGQMNSVSGGTFNAEGMDSLFAAPELSYGDKLKIISRSGAVVSLPKLTHISQGKAYDFVQFEATDGGSRIEVPALQQLGLAADWYSFFEVVAYRGGVVDLNALTELPSSGARVRVDGSGSQVLLDSLSSTLVSGRDVSLEVVDGGTLRATSLERLQGAVVQVSGAETRLELPRLTVSTGSSLFFEDGARVSLPNLAEINLKGALSVARSSRLELPSAIAINGLGSINAYEGSQIDLPRLEQFGDGLSTMQVVARGASSLVRAPSLMRFQTPAAGVAPATRVVADGGRIELGAQALELSNFSLEFLHGGSVAAGQLVMFADAKLSGNGALTAEVENRGLIDASSGGGLQIFGGLRQTATGVFKVDWGASFRPVTVDGPVQLDGAIEYVVDVPLDLGDALHVLTAATVVGNFQSGEQLLDTSRLLTTVVVGPNVFAVVTLPGDANLDGRVDLGDFGSLKSHFGFGRTLSEGDFNGDNVANLIDFGLLKANFGRTDGVDARGLAPAGAAVTVPEPASFWILLVGLAWAGFRCRRK